MESASSQNIPSKTCGSLTGFSSNRSVISDGIIYGIRVRKDSEQRLQVRILRIDTNSGRALSPDLNSCTTLCTSI
ncbi:hypothetical protein ACFX2F_032177 [Malus domestica]